MFSKKLLSFVAAVAMLLPVSAAHASNLPVQMPSGEIDEIRVERGYATIGGVRQKLDGAAKSIDAGKADERFDENLDRLRAANALRAEGAQLDTRHAVVIHLVGFNGNKADLSALILQLGARLSKSATVALVGTPDETDQAMRLVQTLSPANRRNFVAGFSADLPVDQVHIAHKNVIAGIVQNPLYGHGRVLPLESQMNGEGKVGAFAYGPIVELAEYLVAGKLVEACAFFNRITHSNISQEEFNRLTLRDLELISRFAIQPVLWALSHEARQLQFRLRSLESAA